MTIGDNVMKIKDGFLLREIAGTPIVVPIGGQVIDFKGMMALNDIGSFIWKTMQTECTFDNVLKSVLESYDVDSDTAKADLEEFLAMVRKNGALDE